MRKYQAWKAKLPADQQAWETVLEQNLGNGFYLPLHKKDKIAGRSNAWDFVQDDPKLPRVLLIGDSISRGYTLDVRKVDGWQGERASRARKLRPHGQWREEDRHLAR
jgi:hypothetical protein